MNIVKSKVSLKLNSDKDANEFVFRITELQRMFLNKDFYLIKFKLGGELNYDISSDSNITYNIKGKRIVETQEELKNILFEICFRFFMQIKLNDTPPSYESYSFNKNGEYIEYSNLNYSHVKRFPYHMPIYRDFNNFFSNDFNIIKNFIELNSNKELFYYLTDENGDKGLDIKTNLKDFVNMGKNPNNIVSITVWIYDNDVKKSLSFDFRNIHEISEILGSVDAWDIIKSQIIEQIFEFRKLCFYGNI